MSVVDREDAARSWMVDAACVGVDPDLFFPEPGASVQEAKAVCAGCPVREECLDYAMSHHENWGIWGGVTARERARMRRTRSPGAGARGPVPYRPVLVAVAHAVYVTDMTTPRTR